MLRDSVTRFLHQVFFMNNFPPSPRNQHVEPLKIFKKVKVHHWYKQHYTSGKFATCTDSVVDTGDIFAIPVNDTGGKFAARVNDTGGK
jgi:hypothetical protein